LKVEKLKVVRDWFMDNEVINFGDPVENLEFLRIAPQKFAIDEMVRKNVVKYFSSFDKSIIDFRVNVKKTDANKERDYLEISSLHKKTDSDEAVAIPFREESAGTLKMFSLYPLLKDVLERGSVLFADELSSNLHPLLARNIIITFLNPKINKKHAQVVFTTHDPWNLKRCLLRRDEIWFTEKNAEGISSLYSLADFKDEGSKIRKDEDYEKNYLLGKYGAIPTLTQLDITEKE
jgi:AAA15 family ATPase/GTPase